MSESEDAKIRTRRARLLALLLAWISKRDRVRARLERLLLPVALVVFVGGTVIALRHLPPLHHHLRWPLFLAVALVGMPLTFVLNAKEYQMSARILGRRVPFSASLEIGLIAAAANQLPIPGSILVRVQALGRLGTSHRRAVVSTALMGLLWIAATGILAGAFQLPADAWVLGAVVFGAGTIALGLSLLLLRSQVRREGRSWLLVDAFAIEGGTVLVSGLRYYLILRGLGFGASPRQAMVLTLAIVIASMAGFLPGGLGLRELLAAGLSPVLGMPASLGLLATAVDRVIGMSVAGAAAAVVLGRRRRRPRSTPGAPEPSDDVREDTVSIERAADVAPGERLRLLVLTTTLPARPGDGTPEFVLSLSRALGETYQVTILAPRVRGAERLEHLDGLTIRRFAYFPKRWEGLADGAILPNLKAAKWRWVEAPFLILSFLWQALRVTKRERSDVIHAHWILPAGLVASVLKGFRGTPYVLTVHGADAYALRGRMFGWLKRRVLRRADVVCPVSRDIAELIASSTRSAPAVVVPMGVEVESIRAAVGERSPVHGRFLFVGRLAEKKGIDVLLRALARVPEATLVVAGEGPELEGLERLSQDLGLGSRVRFVGRLPRAAVMEELRLAFAMVVPSRVARGGDQEGTPVVLGEALAAGVPVIASRLGGLADNIVDGVSGALVEPESVDSLAEALRRAIDNPHLAQAWADEARRHVEGELDLRTTRDRYVEFIDAAAATTEHHGKTRVRS